MMFGFFGIVISSFCLGEMWGDVRTVLFDIKLKSHHTIILEEGDKSF